MSKATVLKMPRWLRNIVAPRHGLVLFYVLVVGAVASGFSNYVDGKTALVLAVIAAVASMTLREWVFIERGREANEYRRLLAGLERATADSHAQYKENVDQVWYIEPDGADRGSITYETTVTTDDSMVWRRVKLFATESTPMVSANVMEFRAREEVEGETEAFLVNQGDQIANYLVIFRSPITANSTRVWHTSYSWPGLWNTLREQGEDHGILEFSNPADRGSIRIVLPSGTPNPPERFLRRIPNVGSERSEEFQGRPSLIWEFGPCLPGQVYRVYIGAQLGQADSAS